MNEWKIKYESLLSGLCIWFDQFICSTMLANWRKLALIDVWMKLSNLNASKFFFISLQNSKQSIYIGKEIEDEW